MLQGQDALPCLPQNHHFRMADCRETTALPPAAAPLLSRPVPGGYGLRERLRGSRNGNRNEKTHFFLFFFRYAMRLSMTPGFG